MALVVVGAAFQLAGTQPRPLQRKADSGRTVTRWSARIATHGSGAARSPTRQRETRFVSAPARWTTLLGRARQRISGPAARSLGSYCRKRIRGFETQPEDLAWMRAGSA